MLRIAIVEDEEIFARELEEYVRRYAAETFREVKITHFSDGEEIAGNYRGGFDLLLMDIQMKFMDGMTAAEKIRERDQEVQIIFITNRNDYAIRGYEVDALDYVLKPVSYYIFARKLDRALAKIESRSGFALTINTKTGLRKIRTTDLYFVESDAHNLIYHTLQGDFTARGRLLDVKETLGEERFVSCNRSFLVNLRHVSGIEGDSLFVGGVRISISKPHRKEILARFSDYVGASL